MTVWICRTCGVEQADTTAPPERCPICSDDRQYVGPGGQRWTCTDELVAEGHRGLFEPLEPGLTAVRVEPRVGIGQRGLLLRTSEGSLLWEPPGHLDRDMVARVRAGGGLTAVAASHPHLVGAAVSWAREFGVPFFFAEHDRRWLRRPDPLVRWWSGRAEPVPGLHLVQCGGHFPGSAVLHWAAGADGRGALLVGDTVMVDADLATVSFMRSYPNLIPLPERLVRQIAGRLGELRFDRIYGGFHGSVVDRGGAAAVRYSADRYIGWLRDEITDPDEVR
ncbi:hydrolase [Nakamurella endophytica]|uniref:hydrolase n=1 Tax=Nakamurella endophytica TaxID=1748367 RepID=UPI0016650A17|nr:hydrolase [Nakamurella endophytica]